MADETKKNESLDSVSDEGTETAGDKATRGGSSREVGRSVGRLRHPSRNLSARAKGFGIGGGYERPYRKEKPNPADTSREMYGPLPPAGYYGTGTAARPFERGQAGFADEMKWYRLQYGETTSGYEKRKK